ncbi:uncharacterized protein [Drosophila kikkawai]|uniref:Uncharacterized protein n=1 Tax=Drosophila kikkawai TaxID=30033 RepID=A0ABM3C4W9_DROKI|nr:uncharacterized protein LOC108083455 isoform X2 [Drosophila kikkawai]
MCQKKSLEKMFEIISFLFLFALALFSWAVLCLQHALEIRKRADRDYIVERNTEPPEVTFEPHECQKPSEPPGPLSAALDFAMSYWVMLALTLGLSKLLQLAGRQAKIYFMGRTVEVSTLTEQTLQPCQQNQDNLDLAVVKENTALKEQLNVLQTHCLEMRELLQELRLGSSSSLKSSSSQECSQSGDEEVVTTGSSQPSQNLYITNNHIHICCDNKESCRQAVSSKCGVNTYIPGPKKRPMIAAMDGKK